jgi:hypothetical protein
MKRFAAFPSVLLVLMRFLSLGKSANNRWGVFADF